MFAVIGALFKTREVPDNVHKNKETLPQHQYYNIMTTTTTITSSSGAHLALNPKSLPTPVSGISRVTLKENTLRAR